MPPRWRTRDINGDQFRQSKSSAISESSTTSVPPRDPTSAQRYTQHLPFQVFCCESGTHVVDPAQSYYAGIAYRAGTDFFNSTSSHADVPEREPDAPCLDSTQAWFCRDLWLWKAKEGMKAYEPDVAAPADAAESPIQQRKRAPAPVEAEELAPRQADKPKDDADANAGSDYDASDLPVADPPEPVWDADAVRLTIPNAVFLAARILVNPRCVTTYAGVSHTQLALDLFGPPDREEEREVGSRQDLLEEWEGAPDNFVCQEQRCVPWFWEVHVQLRMMLTHPFIGQPVGGGRRRRSGGCRSRSTGSCRRRLTDERRPRDGRDDDVDGRGSYLDRCYYLCCVDRILLSRNVHGLCFDDTG